MLRWMAYREPLGLVKRGLAARVLAAWRDPEASWQSEHPAGEPRLLAYAFGASLFLTLARIGVEVVNPTATLGPDGPAWLAAQVLAGLSFLPLAMYGVAAILALVTRLAGGTGSWADTRLAFFWSGFISGPFTLVIQIGAALIGLGAWGSAAGGAVWLWFLAPMLAAAHGFSRLTIISAFACFAVVVFALRAFG